MVEYLCRPWKSSVFCDIYICVHSSFCSVIYITIQDTSTSISVSKFLVFSYLVIYLRLMFVCFLLNSQYGHQVLIYFPLKLILLWLTAFGLAVCLILTLSLLLFIQVRIWVIIFINISNIIYIGIGLIDAYLKNIHPTLV